MQRNIYVYKCIYIYSIGKPKQRSIYMYVYKLLYIYIYIAQVNLSNVYCIGIYINIFKFIYINLYIYRTVYIYCHQTIVNIYNYYVLFQHNNASFPSVVVRCRFRSMSPLEFDRR